MTNAGYIAAAYGLTALIILGYTLSLLRRLHRARRRDSSAGSAPGL